MITIFEPCCIDTTFSKLIEEVRATNIARNFIGYGDWNAARLMEVTIPRAAGGVVGISTGTPSVEFMAMVRRLLLAPLSGGSKLPNIKQMIWVLPPLSKKDKDEIRLQLGEFVNNQRLVICEDNIGMRCYLVSGSTYQFVITGNMYMNKCPGITQLFTLQADKEETAKIWELFRTEAHVRGTFRAKNSLAGTENKE